MQAITAAVATLGVGSRTSTATSQPPTPESALKGMMAPGNTEDAPFPRGKGKKTTRKPSPWKESDWIPTRLDWPGRKVLIAQCRVPDHFHRKDGTRISVHPAFVKAVLYDIALWDKPGASLVSGNESVAHHTQIPLSVVNNAVAALKQAKILDKERRGLSDTSRWIIDWDRIETLRVKFVPKKKLEFAEGALRVPTEEDELPTEEDEELPFGLGDDEIEPEGNQEADDAESLARELHARFDTFGLQAARLPLKSVISIVKSLAKKFDGLTQVQLAARLLDKTQLAQVVNDGVKVPAAYLRRVLETAMTQGIAVENGGGGQQDSASQQGGADIYHPRSWRSSPGSRRASATRRLRMSWEQPSR
jgi:hypothetical protein